MFEHHLIMQLIYDWSLLFLLSILYLIYQDNIFIIVTWMSVNKILVEFNKLGFDKDSLMTYRKINESLNQMFKNNANGKIHDRYCFDQDVADQIWQMCDKNYKQQVLLNDYVSVIEKAQVSLLRKIQQLKQKQQALITQKKKHQELLTKANQLNQQKTMIHTKDKINRQDYLIQSTAQEIQEYLIDYDMVTLTFKPPQINLTLSKLEYIQEVSSYKKKLYGESNISEKSEKRRSRIKQQLAQQSYPIQIQYNGKLTAILYLTLLLVILQMLAGIKKYNFINSICCFSLISIFTLGYFDSRYNKLILVEIGFTVIWDIIWLIVEANTWLNPGQNTALSTLNTGALRFYIAIGIIIVLVKLIIGFLLFSFRDISNEQMFNVQIYKNLELMIGKQEETYYNPITEYLKSIFQQF